VLAANAPNLDISCMALVTTLATVLKTYEYSETSKILRLFTRDHGLCSVIAKGARRPKSRFGGLLEPFTDGVATFYAKEGRDLHTLSSFELRRERQSLGGELVRYAGAGLLTEIALRFGSSARDPELFEQLRHGLDRLVDEKGDVETAILEETWAVVDRLGFGPSIEFCSACGSVPDASERVNFDLAGGGIVCERCRAQATGLDLRGMAVDVRNDLGSLLRGGPGDGRKLATSRIQRDVLRDFIAHHLADHRPLNSFRFLDERLG
jgi:DNA repair protein RecO (recombination protein O)